MVPSAYAPAVWGVRMNPGRIALTRTSGPNSLAATPVYESVPPFADEYAAVSGIASVASIEETVTMLPESIADWNTWHARWAPVSCTSST